MKIKESVKLVAISSTISVLASIVTFKIYLDNFYMESVAGNVIPEIHSLTTKVGMLEENKAPGIAIVDLSKSLRNAHSQYTAEDADKEVLRFIKNISDRGLVVFEKQSILRAPSDMKPLVYK